MLDVANMNMFFSPHLVFIVFIKVGYYIKLDFF